MSVCVLSLWLGVIAVTDHRTGRIPTPLVWPGVVATLVSSGAHLTVLLAAAVAATPYLLAALAGLGGGGDIKLAFAGGGLVADPFAALLVVFVAAVAGLATHSRRSSAARSRPHAPALVAAVMCILALS